MFKAYEISSGIYWVGALEWEERYIHGITMPYGSTNNAYLILDEKITLVDTCIRAHADELLERIADVVNPAEIDYIISNHSEKDHAGSLARVAEIATHAKIVTSNPKGHAILQTYLPPEQKYIPVKSGDTLCIGKRTLKFTHTPMVHWPDNMVTYSPADDILFSNDAFGQFLATSKRFDDENDLCRIMECAKKYFANILTPYAKQTAKAVAAVREMAPKMIAPAHGVIWRSHVADILDAYDSLCACAADDYALVVYSSMYGSTERMALAIAEAFMHKGVTVRLYDLDISDISDIITEALSAKYLAVGSSTHNGTVLPTVGAFLTYLKGLAPKGRIGIAFGSYGWMQSAPTEIAAALKSAKYELPMDPVCEDWNDRPTNEAELFDRICALVDSQQE